jgi:hypothetical protein
LAQGVGGNHLIEGDGFARILDTIAVGIDKQLTYQGQLCHADALQSVADIGIGKGEVGSAEGAHGVFVEGNGVIAGVGGGVGGRISNGETGAGGIVEQHRDIVGVGVCDDNIVQAIPIEIPDRHSSAIRTDCDIRVASEAAKPIPQTNRHSIIGIRGGKIVFAIPIEVPDRHREGT